MFSKSEWINERHWVNDLEDPAFLVLLRVRPCIVQYMNSVRAIKKCRCLKCNARAGFHKSMDFILTLNVFDDRIPLVVFALFHAKSF